MLSVMFNKYAYIISNYKARAVFFLKIIYARFYKLVNIAIISPEIRNKSTIY